jgi:hypothetical protein
MRKSILIIIAGFLVSFSLYSQNNEYRYMAIKFGGSHGFSQTPGANENKFVHSPVGEIGLEPVKSAYVPGFTFAILYHFDFNSDNAGIYTGIEYNLSGIGAKYKTTYNDYTMKEINRFHSVGIPLAFKYGPKFLKTQRYVSVGLQANMLLAMNSVDHVNWNEAYSSEKVSKDALNKVAFNVFLNVNYLAFNIQFDYYPKSFFNTLYVTSDGIKPFAGQSEHVFIIKTTINVPYGWLSQQSFWWRKVLRKTPWK